MTPDAALSSRARKACSAPREEGAEQGLLAEGAVDGAAGALRRALRRIERVAEFWPARSRLEPARSAGPS